MKDKQLRLTKSLKHNIGKTSNKVGIGSPHDDTELDIRSEPSGLKLINTLKKMSIETGIDIHFDCKVKGVHLDISWRDEKEDSIIISVESNK